MGGLTINYLQMFDFLRNIVISVTSIFTVFTPTPVSTPVTPIETVLEVTATTTATSTEISEATSTIEKAETVKIAPAANKTPVDQIQQPVTVQTVVTIQATTTATSTPKPLTEEEKKKQALIKYCESDKKALADYKLIWEKEKVKFARDEADLKSMSDKNQSYTLLAILNKKFELAKVQAEARIAELQIQVDVQCSKI